MSAADEAREKLEGVTPGRWWWTNEIRQRLIADGSPDDLAYAREIIRCAALLHPSPADAEFIAWCREGVPALLAELAKAQARADELQTFARGQEIVRAALESDLQTLEEIRALHNADGTRHPPPPTPIHRQEALNYLAGMTARIRARLRLKENQ